MVSKLVILAALIAAVHAGINYGYSPYPIFRTPAHYDYGYAVNDPLTGDSKSQHEIRRGDVVQGSYSLVDPDGSRRTVTYVADSVNGFQAVVQKEPLRAVRYY